MATHTPLDLAAELSQSAASSDETRVIIWLGCWRSRLFICQKGGLNHGGKFDILFFQAPLMPYHSPSHRVDIEEAM